MRSSYSFLSTDPNFGIVSPESDVMKLAREIGQWSKANFGVQRSKATGQVLGHLAPLMGIFEEYGELIEPLAATRGNITTENAERIRDAFADIVIYTMDFCWRSWSGAQHRIAIELAWPKDTVVPENTGDVFGNVIIHMGRLAHATLKHHQGIRGMDDTILYRQTSFTHVSNMLHALDIAWKHLSPETGTLPSLYDNARRVFDAVVAKRDWKKAPTTGDEADVAGTEHAKDADVS